MLNPPSELIERFKLQPTEIQIQILSFLSIPTLKNLCSSSKYFETLCFDERLWEALVQKNCLTENTKESWRQTFIHQHKIGDTLSKIVEMLGYENFLGMGINTFIRFMTIVQEVAEKYRFEFSEDEIEEMKHDMGLVDQIYQGNMSEDVVPPDPYKLYVFDIQKFVNQHEDGKRKSSFGLIQDMIYTFVEQQYENLKDKYSYAEVNSVIYERQFTFYMVDKLTGSNGNEYRIEYDTDKVENSIRDISNPSLKLDFDSIIHKSTLFADQMIKLLEPEFLLNFLKTPILGLHNMTIVNTDEPYIEHFVHIEVSEGNNPPLTIFETGEDTSYEINSKYIRLYDILVGVMSVKSSKEDFGYEAISGVESFDLKTQTLVLEFANGD